MSPQMSINLILSPVEQVRKVKELNKLDLMHAVNSLLEKEPQVFQAIASKILYEVELKKNPYHAHNIKNSEKVSSLPHLKYSVGGKDFYLEDVAPLLNISIEKFLDLFHAIKNHEENLSIPVRLTSILADMAFPSMNASDKRAIIRFMIAAIGFRRNYCRKQEEFVYVRKENIANPKQTQDMANIYSSMERVFKEGLQC